MHSIIGSPGAVLKSPPALLSEIRSKLNNIRDLLIDQLEAEGLPHSGRAFLEFERSIHRRSCELINEVTGAVLTALNDSERFRTAAEVAFCDDKRFRPAGPRTTTVRLLGGGTVQLRTPYWARVRQERRGRRRKVGRRGKGGAGVLPVLVCLGIQWGATPALASVVAREAADSTSYECAQASLATWGVELHVKTIRRLAMAVGKKGLKVRQARIEAAGDGQRTDQYKGKVIAVGVDGGRLRTRIPRVRGRRKKETNRRGYDCPWREPKCFVIYEIGKKGRRKACTFPVYEATLEDCDALFEILLAELKLRGASQAKRIIFLADGAEWIWDRVALLVDELGIAPSRVYKALDFYHALENLHETAELRTGWSKRKKAHWVTKMKKQLRRGQVDEVIVAVEQLCRGRNAKAIRTKRDYFDDRKEFMAYGKLRHLGLPIGSGAIESAVRRIVNLRLKGCGIFWLEANGEAMLYLRAHLKAGRWDETFNAILSDLPVTV